MDKLDHVKCDYLEKQKLLIFMRYSEGLENLYRTECARIMRDFVRDYPNHKIEWVSGMGTCFWVINNKIIYFDDYKFKDARLTSKLMPLIKFYNSIRDCPSYRNICTGDIEL